MFVSVKERARQIANGQFTALGTSTTNASPMNIVPESKPVTIAAPMKAATTGSPAKTVVLPSKSNPSKATSSKKPAAQQGTPEIAALPQASPKVEPSKSASAPGIPEPKKVSARSKVQADSTTKSTSSKIGSPKIASKSKAASQGKTPSTPKIASSTKPTSTAKPATSKATCVVEANKRSKSPPKRVDSPIEEDSDPLSTLKATCLKQLASVTGLGGRRLTIVLKQRSSGEWYAALKDTGSDKYLKMWMNRDKTFATKEEALEAYLKFVTKMRNEIRWFPINPRATSAKGKKEK